MRVTDINGATLLQITCVCEKKIFNNVLILGLLALFCFMSLLLSFVALSFKDNQIMLHFVSVPLCCHFYCLSYIILSLKNSLAD